MPRTYWFSCAFAIALAARAQNMVGQIEPNAGSWRTWVLKSGNELRLAPPVTDRNGVANEIAWLKGFMTESKSSPDAQQQLRYWTAGAPSYRWMQLLLSQIENKGLTNPRNVRALALMSIAMYDATIAAWDSKYAYKRPRPSEADPSIVTAGSAPRSPSYPSEMAVTAAAAADILGYIWPADARSFQDLAGEAMRAHMAAGFNYPSDVIAGIQLGHWVAAKVMTWADGDGTQAVWTGTAPAGPGLWNGTNPIEPLAGTWKTWVLSSGSELRPSPPYAYDSPEKKAELDQVKNFARGTTAFATNEKAMYYQAAEGIFTYWYEMVSRRLFELRQDENPPRAARAYALTAIAQYDAIVACWDGKYAYWAIRPFQLDSTLLTLFPTPNHPSYPAAHGCSSGALGRVIGRLFPDSADSMEAKASEAGESRLWGGIHYRSDIDSGLAIGRRVGDLVMEKAASDGSR